MNDLVAQHPCRAAAATPQPDWGLDHWLAWQEQLHPTRIDLGLERVRQVALRLSLLPATCTTLSFAGTNGKGSSAVLAAEIYRAAGYRTGCYTSPHLLHYNERVNIHGQPVTDAALCEAFHAVEKARADISLTYFEFGTLAALWLFRQAQVHIQVLEVGLGARLDAVNIVDADCAVVTSIGLDHVDLLGPDRESIGREKGAIYRADRPAVCADRDPPPSIIHAGRRSRFVRIGTDFDGLPDSVNPENRWHWYGWRSRYENIPLPALPGEKQLDNAAGVLAAIESLQALRPVSRDAIESGLRRVRLPGRLEHRGDLLLDVGHNGEAIQALARHIQRQQLVPRAVVIGMMHDKPVEKVATLLAGLCDAIYAAGLPPPRGLPGPALAARLATGGIKARSCADVPAALSAARAQTSGFGPIVVCGSFKTVAAAIESQTEDQTPC